jgi:hypothetical protein
MAVPARDDLANILEQGLKIGWQRIARAVQVPNHLVQVIAKPYQLPVDQPLDIAAGLAPDGNPAFLIEQQGAPEMNRPHADSLGAFAKAFEFIGGKAQVELLVTRF